MRVIGDSASHSIIKELTRPGRNGGEINDVSSNSNLPLPVEARADKAVNTFQGPKERRVDPMNSHASWTTFPPALAFLETLFFNIQFILLPIYWIIFKFSQTQHHYRSCGITLPLPNISARAAPLSRPVHVAALSHT